MGDNAPTRRAPILERPGGAWPSSPAFDNHFIPSMVTHAGSEPAGSARTRHSESEHGVDQIPMLEALCNVGIGTVIFDNLVHPLPPTLAPAVFIPSRGRRGRLQ